MKQIFFVLFLLLLVLAVALLAKVPYSAAAPSIVVPVNQTSSAEECSPQEAAAPEASGLVVHCFDLDTGVRAVVLYWPDGTPQGVNFFWAGAPNYLQAEKFVLNITSWSSNDVSGATDLAVNNPGINIWEKVNSVACNRTDTPSGVSIHYLRVMP